MCPEWWSSVPAGLTLRVAGGIAINRCGGELPGRIRGIRLRGMAKKGTGTKRAKSGDGEATTQSTAAPSAPAGRPSALIDTRVIYCGDNLEQLAKLPDRCVDLIYIDPPFNSNRNYEVF